MNHKNTSSGKSPFILLGLGVGIGGLAMASISQIVPSAQAQQNYNARTIAGISKTNMDALRNLDESFADLAAFVAPSVVHITSESSGSKDGMNRFAGTVTGVGSGVIIRPDGWIMTNDHVVNGFDKVTVYLNDGRKFPGKVYTAPENDLAVVKIEANNLPAATFADSSKVRTGQFAMAVGAPFGLDNSVTFGHISAIGRQSTIPDERASGHYRFYPDLIQTDASINMGNSGGPLMNIDGQVVGINSAIETGSGGSVGIGFAIPSNEARVIGDTLISKGKVVRGALGLVPQNLEPYELKDRNLDGGAKVADLTPGGPADKAGIKKDDLIVRVGAYPVKNEMDVRDSMLHFAPGSTADVEVIRGNDHKVIAVHVADRADLEKLYPKQQDTPMRDNGGGLDGSPFDFGGGDGQMPDLNKLFRDGQNNDQAPVKRTGQARLGVGVQTIDDSARKEFNIPSNVGGVVVMNVEPGSVAEHLGIEQGWVIQSINGKKLSTAQDLVDALKSVKWGDSVQMKYGKYGEVQIVRDEPVKFR